MAMIYVQAAKAVCADQGWLGWVEAHPALGGWAQALGGLLLLIVTATQLVAAWASPIRQRRDFIRLCDGAIAGLISRVRPTLQVFSDPESEPGEWIDFSQIVLTPEYKQLASLCALPISAWPSMGLYRSYTQLPKGLELIAESGKLANQTVHRPAYPNQQVGAVATVRRRMRDFAIGVAAYDAAAEEAWRWRFWIRGRTQVAAAIPEVRGDG